MNIIPILSFQQIIQESLCNYWEWKNKAPNSIYFGTEANWPGYGGFSPQDLIKYWSMQLRIFYEKGASCLFVSHWGTIDSPEKIPQKVMSGSLLPAYQAWQDSLVKFREAPVKIINNNFAFNLSCEQGITYSTALFRPAFAHNRGYTISRMNGRGIIDFPLNMFSKVKANYETTGLQKTGSESRAYDGKGDFVTNYMIQNSTDYIQKNYEKFYLTGTSQYIPGNIKLEFKKNN